MALNSLLSGDASLPRRNTKRRSAVEDSSKNCSKNTSRTVKRAEEGNVI